MGKDGKFEFLYLQTHRHTHTHTQTNSFASPTGHNMDRIESGADVPFGGLDDDQLRLGVQTPKTYFLCHKEAFQVNSAKNSNLHIFKTIYRISIKLDSLM